MGTDEGRRAGRHAHPKRHRFVEINPTIAKQSLDLLVRVLGREALGLGQTLSDRVDGQRARRSEGRPRRPTRATRRAWREDPRRRARRQTCGRPRAGTSVLWLPASSGRGRPARELWGWKPAATSVSMRAPAFRGEQPSRACVAKNRSCPAYAGGAGRCLPRSDRKWRLRLAAEARSDEGLPQACSCCQARSPMCRAARRASQTTRRARREARPRSCSWPGAPARRPRPEGPGWPRLAGPWSAANRRCGPAPRREMPSCEKDRHRRKASGAPYVTHRANVAAIRCLCFALPTVARVTSQMSDSVRPPVASHNTQAPSGGSTSPATREQRRRSGASARRRIEG
jgi:hypothetical protein